MTLPLFAPKTHKLNIMTKKVIIEFEEDTTCIEEFYAYYYLIPNLGGVRD